MNLTLIIQALLETTLPVLKRVFELVVMPLVIKKSYAAFDKLSNKQIKRLVDLLDKIKTTENPNKKKQHIKGFKIGTMFLKTLGEKLLGAYEILEKELNAFEGASDDNNT